MNDPKYKVGDKVYVVKHDWDLVLCPLCNGKGRFKLEYAGLIVYQECQCMGGELAVRMIWRFKQIVIESIVKRTAKDENENDVKVWAYTHSYIKEGMKYVDEYPEHLVFKSPKEARDCCWELDEKGREAIEKRRTR